MQSFEFDFPSVALFEDFPHEKIDSTTLHSDKALYRSHNASYPWLFFDESSGGRFNGCLPSNPPGAISGYLTSPFGGCYVASSSKGAIGESIFRNIHQKERKFIERSMLRSRRMTEIFIPEGASLKLVDVTSAKTRTHLGFDTQIYSTPNYEACFAWAHLFRIAGYAGIKYRSRNLYDTCYVLFSTDVIYEDCGDSIGLLDSDRFLEEVEEIAARLGVLLE